MERIIQNEKVQKKLQNAGILLLLLLLAFLVSLKSPLNLWQKADASIDSSVFQYIASLMHKGAMPYRDTFDHKGPLIYFVNWLGMFIAYYRGVWVIELFSLCVSFLLCYKIARLAASKLVSCIAVAICGLLWFDYFDGGNFTEEYAVPFLAVSLFIFLDYFLHRKITWFRLAACGFSFGAVCLLRINMISLWVVFCLQVLILCIKEKQWVQLRKFVIYFLAGCCLIVVPVLIWLIYNHALGPFIEDYFKFNMMYSSAEGGRASFPAKWKAYFFFLNKMEILLAVFACIYLKKTKNSFLYTGYLCYLFVTLAFICMSGQTYSHYGMILIPAVVFPAAVCIELIARDIKGANKPAAVFTVFFLMSVMVLPNWLEQLSRAGALYVDRQKNNHSGPVLEVCDFIATHTDPDDRITVYGNWDIIYVISKRESISKYSYQGPIGSVNPSIMDEYFQELEDGLPKVVVVQYEKMEGRFNERMQMFLDQNGYAQGLDNVYIRE